MGKLVTVEPGTVRTSQDFVKEGTIAYIIDCYEKGNTEGLPPTPIVRLDEDGNYVAIDGHNLLVVDDMLGKELEVYVVSSANDFLEGDDEGVIARNLDLKNKYDSALEIANALRDKGIETIRDLRLSKQ